MGVNVPFVQIPVRFIGIAGMFAPSFEDINQWAFDIIISLIEIATYGFVPLSIFNIKFDVLDIVDDISMSAVSVSVVLLNILYVES